MACRISENKKLPRKNVIKTSAHGVLVTSNTDNLKLNSLSLIKTSIGSNKECLIVKFN